MTIRARQVRELALQLLFTFDATNNIDSETVMQVTLDAAPDDVTVRTRAVEAATAAWNYRKDADAWLERLAPQWPPYRQPAMDRAILRYALYELTATEIPPKVVLDEAIELAKLYSTADSGAFVNGLLDAALKEITALKGASASTG